MEKLFEARTSLSLMQGAIAQAKKNINNNWCVETRQSKKRAAAAAAAIIDPSKQSKRQKVAVVPSVQRMNQPVKIQEEFVCSSLSLVTLNVGQEIEVLAGDHRYRAIVQANPYQENNRNLTLENLEWAVFKNILLCEAQQAVVIRYLDYSRIEPLKMYPCRLLTTTSDKVASWPRIIIKKQCLQPKLLRRFLSTVPDKEKGWANGLVHLMLQEISGDDAQTRSVVQCMQEIEYEKAHKEKNSLRQKLGRTKDKVESASKSNQPDLQPSKKTSRGS